MTVKAAQIIVSTHSRPKAAGREVYRASLNMLVSTHSRPKAAGPTAAQAVIPTSLFQHTAARRRLGLKTPARYSGSCFNTQPPEGGWCRFEPDYRCRQCFNTQPPEGGWCRFEPDYRCRQCFNTQPPEGGWIQEEAGWRVECRVSTHSRPKAAGSLKGRKVVLKMFQHTAARRRLEPLSKALLHQVLQSRFR